MQKMCKDFQMTILPFKSKTMVFLSKLLPVRMKILLKNTILEQILHFKYLGCDVSFYKDENFLHKLNKFRTVCSKYNTLKNKARSETKLNFIKH